MASTSTAHLRHTYPPSTFPPSFPYTRKQLQPYDPSSDRGFYKLPRFVNHIDDNAIASLGRYYDACLPRGPAGERPMRILDLCSSWVSHIPLPTGHPGGEGAKVKPEEGGRDVVGIGMNAQELGANPILRAWEVWDLNAKPDFRSALLETEQQAPEDVDGTYDGAICNVSIDYLSSPLEITEALGKVLKKGAWAEMIISNRCFPTKVVSPWRTMSEPERLDSVASYFHFAGCAYNGEATTSGKETGRRPGELFAEIERVVIVPPGGQTDPLWAVRGRRA